MFTKLLRRNVTREIIPFPFAVIEYFCGEVFWNDINILFPIKFSLPPPSFPSSLFGLMVSPFLQYTIICYYPYLFWCSECSRSDTVTSVSLGYISIFKYFLTFQNNRLILFFLGLRNKLFLQWALDSFRSQDRGIWGAHFYWGVMSSRSSQWRELKAYLSAKLLRSPHSLQCHSNTKQLILYFFPYLWLSCPMMSNLAPIILNIFTYLIHISPISCHGYCPLLCVDAFFTLSVLSYPMPGQYPTWSTFVELIPLKLSLSWVTSPRNSSFVLQKIFCR